MEQPHWVNLLTVTPQDLYLAIMELTNTDTFPGMFVAKWFRENRDKWHAVLPLGDRGPQLASLSKHTHDMDSLLIWTDKAWQPVYQALVEEWAAINMRVYSDTAAYGILGPHQINSSLVLRIIW